eukprot:a677126_106.p2 GENE.a677126_106~~a677126_106.p2  ORF type:complete len:194 (+),score=49.47 a677126_106:32-583(+)
MGNCCLPRPTYVRVPEGEDDEEMVGVKLLPTGVGAGDRVAFDSDDDWLENASALTETQISMLTRTNMAVDATRDAATLDRETLEANVAEDLFSAPKWAAAKPKRGSVFKFEDEFDLTKIDASSPAEDFPTVREPTQASVEDDFEAFLNAAKANMVARSAAAMQPVSGLSFSGGSAAGSSTMSP